MNEIVAANHYPLYAYKIENGSVSIALDGYGNIESQEAIEADIAQGNDPYFPLFTIDSNKDITLDGPISEAYLVD